MQLTAKIIEIYATQQISDALRKREFVVEFSENPQYPEFIKFECINKTTDLLDQSKVGDNVKISFNLKGRKWTDPQGQVKYFNSLQAWKIEKEIDASPSNTNQKDSYIPTPPLESFDPQEEDLPF